MKARRARLVAAAVVVSGLVTAGSASAVAADPSPPPAAEVKRPVLRLHGAFGAVVGGPPEAPATAYPGVGLDPFLRGAPLRLLTDEARQEVLVTSVVAYPAGGGEVQLLSDGAVAFDGPDTVGTTIVMATVEFDGAQAQRAWLLDVPDRIGDTDALLEIVPPRILLASREGQSPGTPGNGCFAYLCSDIGGLGPVARLEALPVSVGETLTVAADDGSGLVGWVGRLRPAHALSDVVAAGSGHATAGVAGVLALTGLEVPATGEWLLELRVDFDRERGWLWHAYRLVAR